MQTRPARSDRHAIDLRHLVAGFLRMAPDVAIVGEVRDREGLPRDRYPRCEPVTRANAPDDVDLPHTPAFVGLLDSRLRGPFQVTAACPCVPSRSAVPGAAQVAARWVAIRRGGLRLQNDTSVGTGILSCVAAVDAGHVGVQDRVPNAVVSRQSVVPRWPR